MSQKSTRRVRRHTSEEEFKAPTAKTIDTEDAVTEETSSESNAKTELNGSGNNETENEIITRSRSATPQTRKEKIVSNGHETEENEQSKEGPKQNEELEQNGGEPEQNGEESEQNEEPEHNLEESENNTKGNTSDIETQEMDPLILSDEPDPELQFEENSDLECEKGSPLLNRCQTRRSQLRNIPTPKTPKSIDEEENRPETPETGSLTNNDNADLNGTFESCSDSVSTKAEVGSDSTRLEYMDKEISALETNSFLVSAKNQSFSEALKRLPSRRSIRPLSNAYKKRVFQDSVGKTDLNITYPTRSSVEQVPMGVKRKHCDADNEDVKRFKSESPGFFSRFSSPLSSIRKSFRSNVLASTPKLTGYKDDNFIVEDDAKNSKMYEVEVNGEKRWCSIM